MHTVTAQIKISELLDTHRHSLTVWATAGANAQDLDDLVRAWYRMPSATIHAHIHPVPFTDETQLCVTFTPPNDREILRAETHYEHGIHAAQAGQLENALTDFRMASDLNPFNAIYLAALGQAALQLGDLERAESALLHALALDSTNAIALQGLGNLRYWKGDKVGAVSLYEASLRSQETPTALTNLGAALAQLGEYDRAEILFERALALDPHYEKAAVALRLIATRGV